jgi:hypothetical protein
LIQAAVTLNAERNSLFRLTGRERDRVAAVRQERAVLAAAQKT